MKYQEFINENKISLPDYFRKEQELRIEYRIILGHLKHYILYNKNKWGEWEIEKNFDRIDSFELLQTGMLSISIVIEKDDDYSEDISFSKKDVKDFMKFMEDPDLYKAAKKYNL